MEESLIYDLPDDKLIHKWTEAISKDDGCGFKQRENELMQKLNAELNENGKEILSRYSAALENRIDYHHYNLSIKILNFGIKIGMELQNAFKESEE